MYFKDLEIGDIFEIDQDKTILQDPRAGNLWMKVAVKYRDDKLYLTSTNTTDSINSMYAVALTTNGINSKGSIEFWKPDIPVIPLSESNPFETTVPSRQDIKNVIKSNEKEFTVKSTTVVDDYLLAWIVFPKCPHSDETS